MKKILIAMLLVMVMAGSALAGGFGIGGYTYTVSATSGAAVQSISGTTGFGLSGTGTSAWNTSNASVVFGCKEVTTFATSIGGTLTGGSNGNTLASQYGSAFATGTKSGFGLGF